MILRRLGNKSKIAQDIQLYFPPHKIYIEPFFGAGGMFFNKPKAKWNFLNDLDSEVFNLFFVISNHKDEFIKLFDIMPIHQELFDFWMKNEESDPIKKAVRFIFLSNFSLFGKMDTLRLGLVSPKDGIFKLIDKTFAAIKEVQFTNVDFKKMFSSISLNDEERLQSLIYCDPPYIGTTDNYSHAFTEEDANDLFNCLTETGCKYAMSEFDHPFILQQAKERGLNVVTIGERQNLKNRRTEILVMNYNQVPTLF